MKVEESLNVTFDESSPPTKLSPLVDDDVGEEEAIKKNTKLVNNNNEEDESIEVDKIVNIKESKNHPVDQVIGNLNQRTLRSQAQNHSNFFCFISTIEPKNVKEALKDESWVVAMQEELNQFIANDVWESVPLPITKDLDLWHIILNGDFPSVARNKETQVLETVLFEQQDDDLKKKLAKNNEAKMVLYNALPKKDYERIFMCKTAKDIWQSLLITHQEESIDSGFARFNTIITSLKALDEGFSSKNYVRKFLRALHPKWRAKVTVIQESKDLGKKERVKSIALKAKKESSDDETLTSGSDDEEYDMAVRKFKKFFRRKGKFVRQPREEKKSFQQRDEKKGTRPEIENDVEDKNNDETCLMAQSSNEVTLNSSHYSDDASSLDNDKNAKLKETQVKFVKVDKSANSLREILNNQKSPSCKIGLGFDSDKASTSGTKTMSFVGSSAEKGTDKSTIKVHGSTLPGSVSRNYGEKGTEHVFSPPMSSRSDFVITRKKLIHNSIDESKKPSLKPSPKSEKAPYEIFRGRKSSLEYFKVFGSKCFILNTKDYLTKFDPKAYIGVFLGYSQNSKAYNILNKHTMKVEESLNVTFDESLPPTKLSPLVDDHIGEEEAIENNVEVANNNNIED
ncbi:zf-CCHC domain-containing protein [Tanacetum coccineum]